MPRPAHLGVTDLMLETATGKRGRDRVLLAARGLADLAG